MSSENFRFGIEITGTESITQVTSALKELDKELSQKQQAFQQLGQAMQSVPMRQMGIDSGAMGESVKKASTAAADAGKEINKLPLDDAIQRFKQMGGDVDDMTSAFKSVDTEKAKKAFLDAQDVSDSYRDGIKLITSDLGTYNAIMQDTSKEMTNVRKDISRHLRAQSELGRMYRGVGQDIFWLGLGAMFLSMSYSRLRTATKSVEKAQESLLEVTKSVARSQEDYMRAVALYGVNSRDAIDANDAYQMSLKGVKDSEDAVRMAIEQEQLALLTLALGTVPTAVRAAFSLADIIWRQTAAMAFATGQAYSMDHAYGLMATGAIKAQVPILGLTVSFKGLVLAMALATAGITLLVGAITTFIMQSQIDKRMSDMRREIDMTSDSLTGHSLVDSLQEAQVELRNFKKEVAGVRGVNIPEVNVGIRREMGNVVNTDLGRIAPVTNIENYSGIRDLRISFGDVTVREEADIDRIVSKVRKAMGQEIVNLSGGRTYL